MLTGPCRHSNETRVNTTFVSVMSANATKVLLIGPPLVKYRISIFLIGNYISYPTIKLIFRVAKVRWRISCQMLKKMQWDLSIDQQWAVEYSNSNSKRQPRRKLASRIVKFNCGIAAEIQS